MRLRVVSGLIVVLIGSSFATVATTPALAQENPNRPTATQPSPGVAFTTPAQDKPWSYNWVAWPLAWATVLLVVALAAGWALRWKGIGRRTT